jgi:hypothetical protein
MRDGEDGGLGDEFGVWRRMRETLFSLAQISKRMALVGFSFRAVSSARLVPSAVVGSVVESWAAACVLGAQEGVAASLLMHSAVSSAQDAGAALPSFSLCLRPLLRLGRPPGNWALGTRDAVRLFGNIRGAAMAGMHGWSNRANLLVRDGSRLLGRKLASDHGKGNSSLSELFSRRFDEPMPAPDEIIDNQVQLRRPWRLFWQPLLETSTSLPVPSYTAPNASRSWFAHRLRQASA